MAIVKSGCLCHTKAHVTLPCHMSRHMSCHAYVILASYVMPYLRYMSGYSYIMSYLCHVICHVMLTSYVMSYLCHMSRHTYVICWVFCDDVV